MIKNKCEIYFYFVFLLSIGLEFLFMWRSVQISILKLNPLFSLSLSLSLSFSLFFSLFLCLSITKQKIVLNKIYVRQESMFNNITYCNWMVFYCTDMFVKSVCKCLRFVSVSFEGLLIVNLIIFGLREQSL